METKIWYSVQNEGDGSADIKLMESEELCKIDQEFQDGGGWGEPCYGEIVIESDSPIKIKTKIMTAKGKKKELEDELNQDYMKEYKRTEQYPEWFERLEGYLKAINQLEA